MFTDLFRSIKTLALCNFSAAAEGEKQICRDHLASEEIREGIQMYQKLVVRATLILNFATLILNIPLEIRDEVVF